MRAMLRVGRTLLWPLGLLLVTNVVATSAWAGPREDAVALADKAFDWMEQGEVDRAAAAFERAVTLYYTPVIALNWAKAELLRGKLVKAREIVAMIEDKPLPPDAKPSWTKAVEDATILGVELDGRIPTVTVTLVGAANATITIDERTVTAGKPTPVDPGTHDVQVVTAGGGAKTERVTLAEKESRTLEIELGGGVDAPHVPTSLLPSIIGFGVGGLGLLVGTVTGIIFLRKVDELEEACPGGACAPAQAGLLDDTTVLGNVSTAAWVVAGLGAAAGVVFLFVPLGAGEEPVIVVQAAPFGASATVRF